MRIKEIHIGKLKLKNNLVLSAMAGITNSAFRTLCAEGGAGLVTTEMVSCQSLKYRNRKSLKMLELSPMEHPVAVQIFGSEPQAMAQAALAAEDYGADIVDINASCPVKKIMRSGSGALLMKNPSLLSEIISRTTKLVKIPVTVKIRTGWNQNELLSPRLARIMEDSGASAVTVHARPVSMFHAGPVDYAGIEQTAKAVKLPVIGNGGVRTASDAEKIIATGCAGVAIGRAAVENPFVFRDIAMGIEERNLRQDMKEKIKLFLKFLSMNVELYGEPSGITKARKLAGFWLKGFPDSSYIRAMFMSAKTLQEAKDILVKYTDNYETN